MCCYLIYPLLIQFHGSAGLSKCVGTTKQQAMMNSCIREEIAQDSSVIKWFNVFVIEEGKGKVVLDLIKAADHVRHVLNEMRRNRPSKSTSNEVYLLANHHN